MNSVSPVEMNGWVILPSKESPLAKVLAKGLGTWTKIMEEGSYKNQLSLMATY
jgi:hypothetical protein